MKREIIKPRAISGFPDYSEAQNVALSDWLQRIEEIYRTYGFSRLIPRPLELRRTLLSRGGIQKQIFGVSRLPDDNATDLALPFDRTVPLANWVAKNANDIVFPYKRYDISYSFRGERAQAGRFQGFFQADIDIIGYKTLDLNADAECIAVIYEALASLNLGTFIISINNIKLVRSILFALGLRNEIFTETLRVIDKIQKIGPIDACAELRDRLKLPSDLSQKIIDIFSYAGNIQEFLEICPTRNEEIERSLSELLQVWSSLISLGVPENQLAFLPRNVRGLDYYSGIVFETFLSGLEEVGSIASGGRYDDLVSTFSYLSLPGVGGSIGLTRLFDTACKNKLVNLSKRSESQVFVGFSTLELKEQAQEITTLLRRNGVRVDLFSGAGNAKKQFNYADRKGIRFLIMPMKTGIILVRDLMLSNQIELPDNFMAAEYTYNLLKNNDRSSLRFDHSSVKNCFRNNEPTISNSVGGSISI